MVLLRIFLLFLLFYLLIRIVGRFLLGSFRAQSHSAGRKTDHNRQRGREGDMYIKRNPDKKEKLIPKEDGEYVKYEEIDKEK